MANFEKIKKVENPENSKKSEIPKKMAIQIFVLIFVILILAETTFSWEILELPEEKLRDQIADVSGNSRTNFDFFDVENFGGKFLVAGGDGIILEIDPTTENPEINLANFEDLSDAEIFEYIFRKILPIKNAVQVFGGGVQQNSDGTENPLGVQFSNNFFENPRFYFHEQKNVPAAFLESAAFFYDENNFPEIIIVGKNGAIFSKILYFENLAAKIPPEILAEKKIGSIENVDFFDVVCDDAGNFCAVGGDGSQLGSNQKMPVIFSRKNGEWKIEHFFYPGKGALRCICSDGKNFLAAGENGAIIFFDGEKWTEINFEYISQINDIFAQNGQFFLAANLERIFRFDPRTQKIFLEKDKNLSRNQNLHGISGSKNFLIAVGENGKIILQKIALQKKSIGDAISILQILAGMENKKISKKMEMKNALQILQNLAAE